MQLTGAISHTRAQSPGCGGVSIPRLYPQIPGLLKGGSNQVSKGTRSSQHLGSLVPTATHIQLLGHCRHLQRAQPSGPSPRLLPVCTAQQPQIYTLVAPLEPPCSLLSPRGSFV